MKYILLYLLLFISCNAIAQNYSSGILTRMDNKEEAIYFKAKSYVIDKKGNLTVYSAKNADGKMALNATDFASIKSQDNSFHIVTTTINEINNNEPIILRKIVEGKHTLYEYINAEKEIFFIDFHNGTYTVLNSSNKNKDGYQKWLFNNFNETNLIVTDYANLKYRRGDLTDYYLKQSLGNAIKLDQEKEVSNFETSINGGAFFNNVQFESRTTSYENLASIDFKIGALITVNLDKITNRHSLTTGVNYYTPLNSEGTSTASSTVLATEISLQYWSIVLGYQYNIHFNNFSIAPYLSFEPTFFTGDNELTFRDIDSNSEVGTFVLSDPYLMTNLGIRLNYKELGYINLQYHMSSDIEMANSASGFILGNNNGLSLTVGYNILKR